MVAFLGIVAGLALLLVGGAVLVRGASQLAVRLGVSSLVIGLTVVAFGTSAPEFLINVIGAARGETALAFGNVVGSNIANLALVLGVAALLYPINIESGLVRREVPLLLLATAILTVFVLDLALEGRVNTISRADSLVLLLIFCVFIYGTVIDAIRVSRRDPLLQEGGVTPLVPAADSVWAGVGLLLGGLVMLYLGGELTVRSAVALSDSLGIAKTMIGLFVVAVGTSLPELVTSTIAAWRREADLAVGNVIGSNIFNTLFVLPISGVITAIPVPRGGLIDVIMSLLFAAALIPIFVFGKARLNRIHAVLLLVVYGVYVVSRFAFATP